MDLRVILPFLQGSTDIIEDGRYVCAQYLPSLDADVVLPGGPQMGLIDQVIYVYELQCCLSL